MISSGKAYFSANENDITRMQLISDKYGVCTSTSIIRFALAFVINNETQAKRINELEELLEIEKSKKERFGDGGKT